METVKKQLTDFLDKCEEIKNCKFIMATTKIKDLLKSIVNSAELYELFNTVAANFDYSAARQRCFVEEGGAYGHSRVILPDTVGDRLAFIFCLLVEFDRNDINFNAFLQKYYPKDGSYYASYHLFCDEVIGSLESIIRDIYSRELSEEEPKLRIEQEASPDPAAAESLNTVCMLIESERAALNDSALAADEKEAGEAILLSLSSAIRSRDIKLVKSLTCGYNYFVLYNKFVSESLAPLFESIGDLTDVL